MATIDDKITNTPTFWKKAGNAVNYVIGGAVFLVTVVGFGGMFVKGCYEMFPGKETDATVTKIDYLQEFDADGAYMGIDTPILYLDKVKRCLEIPDSMGKVKVGDKFEYINWDFNPRPWCCNEIEEYEFESRQTEIKSNSNSQCVL